MSLGLVVHHHIRNLLWISLAKPAKLRSRHRKGRSTSWLTDTQTVDAPSNSSYPHAQSSLKTGCLRFHWVTPGWILKLRSGFRTEKSESFIVVISEPVPTDLIFFLCWNALKKWKTHNWTAIFHFIRLSINETKMLDSFSFFIFAFSQFYSKISQFLKNTLFRQLFSYITNKSLMKKKMKSILNFSNN